MTPKVMIHTNVEIVNGFVFKWHILFPSGVLINLRKWGVFVLDKLLVI